MRICDDININLGYDNSMPFRIYDGDTVIYKGEVVKKPGEADNIVRINDILSNYLYNAEPVLLDNGYFLERHTFIYPSYQTMEVREDLEKVVLDYGYDEIINHAGYTSEPITGEIINNQHLFVTLNDIAYARSNIQFNLTYKDGTTGVDNIVLLGGTGTLQNLDGEQALTGVLNLRQYPNLKRVEINNSNGLIYEVVDCCCRYILYYTNPFGGWDSLLIKGNMAKTDSYKRYEYKQEYEYMNENPANRGRFNYLNDITRRWELNTGLLDDEAGQKMHYLLGSNNVYLYDSVTYKMLPVLVKDSSCRYKTYKNGGRKIVDYTINVEFSQDRVRRG